MPLNHESTKNITTEEKIKTNLTAEAQRTYRGQRVNL